MIRLKSVVLPAPFGPMIARRSRGATDRVTPFDRRERAEAFAGPVERKEGRGRHDRSPIRPRSAPTIPPGAKRTKRMKVTPRISIQRSV